MNLSTERKKCSGYMLATKAFHKTGDISRDELDLCSVKEEDEENYYGVWVTGYGFMNVRFPKNSTRTLTEKEKQEYMKLTVQAPWGNYKLQYEDFR